MENESHEPPVVGTDDDDATLPASPDQGRRDGWTPFARRLFLEVLSQTGRVTLACEYAQLSKQSAYALRARDPVFAASWDAACELARAGLADAGHRCSHGRVDGRVQRAPTSAVAIQAIEFAPAKP